MKYLLLMYAQEGVWPEAEHRVALAESIELCHELQARGEYLRAAPLHPPQTAVHRTPRRPILANGPFAETKEQLGGYFLIDVGDLDAAMAFAARVPGTRRGTAEVRTVLNLCLPDATRLSPSSEDAEYMILHYPHKRGSEETRPLDASLIWRTLSSRGVLVAGIELAPDSTAKSIQLKQGNAVVSDGPYETDAPPLVTICVVRAPSIRAAAQIAEDVFTSDCFEVREVLKAEGLP